MQEKEWKSVPQFGAWDQKGEISPNYSMVFGQARAQRKQAKMDVKHVGLKNEPIFKAPPNPHVHHHHNHQNTHQDDSTSMVTLSSKHINCARFHRNFIAAAAVTLLT